MPPSSPIDLELRDRVTRVEAKLDGHIDRADERHRELLAAIDAGKVASTSTPSEPGTLRLTPSTVRAWLGLIPWLLAAAGGAVGGYATSRAVEAVEDPGPALAAPPASP